MNAVEMEGEQGATITTTNDLERGGTEEAAAHSAYSTILSNGSLPFT